MNERFGILHVSDIHASEKSESKLRRLVDRLKTDILAIQHQHQVSIKVICVTGDLIFSGDKSEKELEIVREVFLNPIMSLLSIESDHVFIVAGNHEIKQSLINDYIEKGLVSDLVTETAIDHFYNSLNEDLIKRIAYFDSSFASGYGGNTVWSNPLGRAYLVPVGSLLIGVSCLNSAWRSTGIGGAEKGKMVIGRRQIIESCDAIQKADLRICITHHPFDWLRDEDKTAVEKCINKFDIVLNGHIHESNTKIITTFNGQTLFNTCGKFDNTSDIYNGYSVLSIDPYSKDCDVILRQYFDSPRDCFDKALCVAEEGLISTSLGTKDDNLSLAYRMVHSIKQKFLEYANSYFVSNVAEGKTIKSFDESFIIPELRRHSEYEKEMKYAPETNEDDGDIVTLDEICFGKHNILLLGKKEIGKTTVLHYIAKNCFSNFNILKTVPIIINCRFIDYSGKKIIIRAIQKFINEFCDDADSFSSNDIEKLLNAGLFTIMFDDFETVDDRHLITINQFVNDYLNNRFIFSEKRA